jgi:hypothetical protein
MTFRKHWGLTMNIVNVYDWFTKESMDAGLQATEWKQRETFLRLAFDVGDGRTRVPQGRTDDAGYVSIELIEAYLYFTSRRRTV